jgi:copper chaperone CopZ
VSEESCTVFQVEGMDCVGCAQKVERVVGGLKGGAGSKTGLTREK